jgi:hypothetical protein
MRIKMIYRRLPLEVPRYRYLGTLVHCADVNLVLSIVQRRAARRGICVVERL